MLGIEYKRALVEDECGRVERARTKVDTVRFDENELAFGRVLTSGYELS